MNIKTTAQIENQTDWQILYRLLSRLMWLPALTITILVTFYSLTALEVGYFPTYGNPDPKDTLFASLSWLVILGIISSMAIFLLLVVSWSSIIVFDKSRRKRIYPQIFVYSLSMLALLFINFYTPLMIWIMD